MDLCCLLNHDAEAGEPKSASEMVEILGELIRKGASRAHAETDFHVLPLPKARIPIIKIHRRATEAVPCDIACDIGFDNRLALENTRLLLSYAMIDPPRLRTLVLFLKVWTKRRKLNSPYTGTLSSYGYTLLVLFYLIHVKRPPVLPNLQRVLPGRALRADEVELEGFNVYFYDDIDTLRREWHSACREPVGELLLDFFRYFARDFNYAKDAISLHTEAGLVSKESRGWTGEHLCIEDPFQHGYNVSRTVTKDGLYTIRGEFMRAGRLLSNRSARAAALLEELCEERDDGLTRAPDFPSARRHDGPRSLPRYMPREPLDAPFAPPLDFGKGLGITQGTTYPPAPAFLAPVPPPDGARMGYMPYAMPVMPGMPTLMPYAPERARPMRSLSDTTGPTTPVRGTYADEEAVQLSPAPPPEVLHGLSGLEHEHAAARAVPGAPPAPPAAGSPASEAEGGVFSMSPVT